MESIGGKKPELSIIVSVILGAETLLYALNRLRHRLIFNEAEDFLHTLSSVLCSKCLSKNRFLPDALLTLANSVLF